MEEVESGESGGKGEGGTIMSVYRPSYRTKTGEKKISQVWWYNFRFAGKSIQKSSKSTKKTVAREAEKNERRELEKRYAGIPTDRKSVV